ncbi:MAG: 4-hydroxy-tetrahydrodipicolinate reductase [Eubacteriales bacterium]|nr:4-hydroxy-tetrahydrodipicolinate reductase [Eubacteriales bacterium]
MKIIIGGALGHMGRELATAAAAAGVQVACGVDVAWNGQEPGFPMVREYGEINVEADVLIDFSRVEALPTLLIYGEKTHMPLVLCTTGYTDVEQAAITAAAKNVPILQSANMSLGISVLRSLGAMAARALGGGYDVEIIEKHHRRKLDSPSGTALMLYDAIHTEKGRNTTPVFGRHGRDCRRTAEEIGIHAVRGGTVAGEHEIGFYGNAEQIILTHRAESRTLFAEGALRAAKFLLGKPAGRYAMQDVVEELLKQ